MNKQEFNTWWKDFARRFPSVSNWVNRLDERLGEGAGRGQLENWLEVLADTPLDLALRVNQEMASGRLEPPGSFDHERERSALFVRRAVEAKLAHTRQTASAGSLMVHQVKRRTKRDAMPIREMVAKLLRLVKSGRTHEEARLAIFPPSDETSTDPRDCYKCLHCRDTGLCDVWHIRSMDAYRTDPELLDHPCNRSVMAVPCSCDEGDRFMTSKGGSVWDEDMVRFDVNRYCLTDCGDTTSETAIRDFKSWCAAFFERIDSAAANRMKY